LRTEIDQMIADTAEAFAARDDERATRTARPRRRAPRRVRRAPCRPRPRRGRPPHAVGRALAARYLKRIVAHLTNVLSAVVMPIDRLDYFDEDPEDRE
jgi:phosphate uptake regulator